MAEFFIVRAHRRRGVVCSLSRLNPGVKTSEANWLGCPGTNWLRRPTLTMRRLVLTAGLMVLGGCVWGNSQAVHVSSAETQGAVSFRMDGWADNWFAAYLDETLLVEDSVPITTVRSFNAEMVTFRADYPLHLNLILKDYKENDTGLEYIGTRRQQRGDGGFMLQLTDLASHRVVAVSGSDWACTVINTAPLDKACEKESNPVAGIAPCTFLDRPEPAGWKGANFDDSQWKATTIHTATAVGPKGGYSKIRWDPAAKFVWGPDLKADNTVLCRITVRGPGK